MQCTGLAPLSTIAFALAACVSARQELGFVATSHRVIAADNARDLEAVLDCYTDDAVWMPPDGPTLHGKAAIRPRYESMFARYTPEIRAIPDNGWHSGDHAIECGTTKGRLVPRDGGAPQELDDKYMMVLRRESDGVWRIERLMWSSNAKR